MRFLLVSTDQTDKRELEIPAEIVVKTSELKSTNKIKTQKSKKHRKSPLTQVSSNKKIQIAKSVLK